MQRRSFVAGLVSVVGMPRAVEAQPTGTVPRVGILTVASTGDQKVLNNFDALRQGLRERGWVDGENIGYEYRWQTGDTNACPSWRPILFVSGSTSSWRPGLSHRSPP